MEIGMYEQVLDILNSTSAEVVDHRHLMPHCEETIRQMRADEAGTAGDQDGGHLPYLLAVLSAYEGNERTLARLDGK